MAGRKVSCVVRIAAAAVAAAVALPIVVAETPASVIAVPLTRDDQLSQYMVKVQVGTPPQTEFLKIDTGSPRYSFMDPRNEVCQRDSQPCVKYGTFDNRTSSTSRYEGSGFADALGPVGMGDYLSDIISLGGVSIEDMYFGYTSRYSFPDRIIGDARTILGLSLECGFAGPKCTDKVSSYLLPELKNASKIDYMASSIYLGPDDKEAANAQMLLGGSYDRAKSDGNLITVPMVDPFSLELTGGQTNVVNVTAVEIVIGNGGNGSTTETYGDEGVGVPVLIDTGVANWYLTDKTWPPIYHALGGVGDPDQGGRYTTVDCKYADPARSDGHVSVVFGPHGQITIPFHALVSKFPDGTCGVYISSRGDTVAIFGDPFLRGVYSIFDQENFSITMGHVKHTDEEDIVPLPEGGFKPTHSG